MIEVVGARSGDRTLSFGGKLLASSIDPRSEAERWCEKYKAELMGIKTAFVLGAGAAYHLPILQKTFPHLNIICIEFNRDIIKQVKDSIEISLLGVSIHFADSAEEIFDIEEVQKALLGSYKVLVHPSTKVHAAEKANESMLQLNGRLEFGLQRILSLRSQKEDIRVPEIEANKLFQLQDLEDSFISEDLGDVRIYNSARELLK